MARAKKIKVLVLFGGRSSEHEVSLLSANSVIRYLDSKKYEVLACAIDKRGSWILQEVKKFELGEGKALKIQKSGKRVCLSSDASKKPCLVGVGGSRALVAFDVAFPVMHGPLCEDGSIQGWFDLCGVPYVGCGVLSSAMSRDKALAKQVVRAAGVPVVPYTVLNGQTWRAELGAARVKISEFGGYPVFVKPTGQGSSVGVTKVRDAAGLEPALTHAFEFDQKVLVERGIDAREIEVSVLENRDPSGRALVSGPGEVVPSEKHEFYTYEAKYTDPSGAKLLIPAPLDPSKRAEVQGYAARAFEALLSEGMARVDFLMDKKSGQIFFNESNTIPGFTSISMYPKMWEASGLAYTELLSRLVELALARQTRRSKLLTER